MADARYSIVASFDMLTGKKTYKIYMRGGGDALQSPVAVDLETREDAEAKVRELEAMRSIQ